MLVRIGARVFGADGELGTIQGMVVNQRGDAVEDLIVRHGMLGGQERQVPFAFISRVDDDGTVQLNVDHARFAHFLEYTDAAYRVPDADWVAPPAADQIYPVKGAFEVDVAVDRGAVGFGSGKPGRYPGGNVVVSEDQQMPVIRHGMPILDLSGEKVGEVGDFEVDTAHGKPVRLTSRTGLLFKHERELPMGWIKQLARDGVVLKLARHDMDAHQDVA